MPTLDLGEGHQHSPDDRSRRGHRDGDNSDDDSSRSHTSHAEAVSRPDVAATRLDTVSQRLERIEGAQMQLAADQHSLMELCSGISHGQQDMVEVMRTSLARLEATVMGTARKQRLSRNGDAADPTSSRPITFDLVVNRTTSKSAVDHQPDHALPVTWPDAPQFRPIDSDSFFADWRVASEHRTLGIEQLSDPIGGSGAALALPGLAQSPLQVKRASKQSAESKDGVLLASPLDMREMESSPDAKPVNSSVSTRSDPTSRCDRDRDRAMTLDSLTGERASSRGERSSLRMPSNRGSRMSSTSSTAQPHPSLTPATTSDEVSFLVRNSLASAGDMSFASMMPKEPIPIREGWDKIPNQRGSYQGKNAMHETGSLSVRKLKNSNFKDEIFVVKPESKLWRALNPDTRFRTSWDVTSMLMLLYDAFTVPYILSWNLPLKGSLAIFAWIARIFWTIDLPLSIVTGFRTKDQKLEVRLDIAVMRYMKTWCCPDVAFVVCDWISLVLSADPVMQNLKNILRCLRLVRGIRQAPRAAALWQKAHLASPVKEVQLGMDILRLILFIFWANHVVSCAWYAVGRHARSDTGQTWLSVNKKFDEAGEQYQYATALHWAMTQMTPGSMEVVPKNTTERLFNVGCLFFGLILGSSLVATLTSMMTQYRMQGEDFTKKSVQLQRYLQQLQVQPDLAMAIKLQVRRRAQERKRIKGNDVAYLKFMSDGLREEMHYRFYVIVFKKHIFLNLWDQVDESSMRFLCQSTRAKDYSATDMIFAEGDMGDTMYFLISGELSYLPAMFGSYAPTMSLKDNACVIVTDKDRINWCSEPALWTDWMHLGSLEAVATAEVLHISASNLQKDLMKFPRINVVLKEYCIAFHRFMNEPGVVCSDLPQKEGMDCYEIISTLPQSIRLTLAEPVLNHLRGERTMFKKRKLTELEEEVYKGKSNVAFFSDEVVRTVFVIAVRICRDLDGRFLVHIAEVMRQEPEQLKKMCVLPGVKRQERESIGQSINRLIRGDLEVCAGAIDIDYTAGAENDVFFKDSASYGIRTRYSRTIFQARLTDLEHVYDIEMDEVMSERVSRFSKKSTRIKGATPSRSIGVVTLLGHNISKRSTGDVFEAGLDILEGHKVDTVAIKSPNDKKVDHKIYLWLNEAEFRILSDPECEQLIGNYATLCQETTAKMFRIDSPREGGDSEPDETPRSRVKVSAVGVEETPGGKVRWQD